MLQCSIFINDKIKQAFILEDQIQYPNQSAEQCWSELGVGGGGGGV